MIANNNNPNQAKKCYVRSFTKEEIKKELCIVFDSQTCSECGQDHSFKNTFEDVKTSIDDFPVYFRSRISGIAMSVVGGKTEI